MDELSSVKVTYDPSGTPLVLLDAGQRTSRPFIPPWEQETQVESLLGADWAGTWGRGNVRRQIEVTAVVDYATAAAMVNAVLAADAARPVGQVKPLKVEVTGGHTYQAASSVIVRCVPTPKPESGVNRVEFAYTLQVGAFVKL